MEKIPLQAPHDGRSIPSVESRFALVLGRVVHVGFLSLMIGVPVMILLGRVIGSWAIVSWPIIAIALWLLMAREVLRFSPRTVVTIVVLSLAADSLLMGFEMKEKEHTSGVLRR